MKNSGCVYLGINNIYTVKLDDASLDNRTVECRIKGKQLKGDRVYNPITVGDIVQVEIDPHQDEKGLVLERKERTNVFARYNKKRKSPQVLMANVDEVICVSSVESPPFRPRFLDRVIVMALVGDVTVRLIVNKCDLGISDDVRSRMKVYESLGYPVHYCSAENGEGIEELKSLLKHKTCGVIGQSGVGKSSLLNALSPGLGLETGALSKKYNRGSHTTCYAAMFDAEEFKIIDTPGIREIDIYGIDIQDLGHYFSEFEPFLHDCAFSPCLHDHEPKCKVKEAVENGRIHPDRYDSYLRILEHMRNAVGQE